MGEHTNSPKVSVVIPVYNVSPYIQECLESLARQTFTLFELLIVDDCSTDDSMEIARKFLDLNTHISYRIIIHEENKGLSAARNTGIEAAHGQYIVFVDSDDWVANDMLENFVREINCSPDSIVCGNTVQFVDDVYSSYYGSNERLILNNNEAILRMLLYDKVIDTAWAKIYPLHLFMDNNIRFPDKLYFEDTPTNLRLFNKAKSIIAITNEVYFYRRNRAGSILQQKSYKSVTDRLTVFENVYDYLLSDTGINKDFTFNYYANRIASEYRTTINGYKLSILQQHIVLKNISGKATKLRKECGNRTLKKYIGVKFNFLLKRPMYKSQFLFLLLHNSFYSLLKFLVDFEMNSHVF